jgi:acyl carrier protein
VDLSAWEEDAAQPESKKLIVMLNGANSKPKGPEMPKPEMVPTEQAPIDAPVTQSQPPQSKPFEAQASQAPKNENIALDSSVCTTASPQQRSTTQGNTMTSFPHPEFNDTQSHPTSNSTQPATVNQVPANPDILVQGLNAMQQLQAQTARAHEKFLETQTQASQALAALMSQTRGQMPAAPPAAPVVQHQAPVQAAPQYQPQRPTQPPAPPVQQTVPTPEPAPTPQAKVEPSPAAVPEPPVQPVAAAPAPEVKNVLFEIVSRLTGFPVEMLEPEMNIESDLGVDSIKKVEIISELEKAFPDSEDLSAQRLGSVKTLGDICTAVETDQTESGVPEPIAAPTATGPNEPKNNKHPQSQDTTTLDILVNIISELTGFPQEMLEPSMNLESDLGIDSIKRVEILSRLEQEQPDAKALSSDDMGSLQTIADIINYLAPDETKASPKAPKKKLRMTP